MKKLIITLAAVALAIGAQASCAAWSFKTTTNITGLDGSTLYVVLGDYGATAPNFADLKSITDISYNGATGYATTTKTKPAYSTSVSGEINSASLTSSTPNFYMVLVSATADSFWVSDVQDASSFLYEPGSAQAGTLSLTPSTIGSFTPMSSGPEPVPEPTSAILLLLGMAGVALKRKRA